MSTTKISAQDLVEGAERVRREQGEEAYQRVVLELAGSILGMDHGEDFLKAAFPDLDMDKVRESIKDKPKAAPEDALMSVLRLQVPSIRTQAHFNTFMAAFDALRLTLDGYFSGNFAQADKAKEALNTVLVLAAQMPELHQKAQEVPEGDRGDATREFLAPAKEILEYDYQRGLMVGLSNITAISDLNEWYAETKTIRDRIVSQSLRNQLMDAIRAKRIELQRGSN